MKPLPAWATEPMPPHDRALLICRLHGLHPPPEPNDSTWPVQVRASIEKALRGAEQRVAAAESESARLREALRTHGVCQGCGWALSLPQGGCPRCKASRAALSSSPATHGNSATKEE